MIDSFKGQFRFLSNFYPAPITFDNKEYLTSEHLYQALKTLDPQEREWVRISATPGEAKRRGRKVTKREDWDDVKENIMRAVLNWKFAQNPDLMEKLAATGNEELIEANTWGDTEWGVCFGTGKNKLGLLLQEIRAEIQLKLTGNSSD